MTSYIGTPGRPPWRSSSVVLRGTCSLVRTTGHTNTSTGSHHNKIDHQRGVRYLASSCGLPPPCADCIITYHQSLYFSIERPQVTFFDKEYYSSVIFKSRRVNRKDPVHYVTVNYTSLKVMDNHFTLSLYFYELLSNVYKRSFVEIHNKVCDLLERDEIVGDAFRDAYNRVPQKERPQPVLKCPLKPGMYVFPNMRFRLNALVHTFPFEEGRVYVNVTHKGRPTGRGHVDFHLKPLPKS